MTKFSATSSSVAKGGGKAGFKENPNMQIGGPKSGLGMHFPPSKNSTSEPPSVLDEPNLSNRAHDPVHMINSAAGLTYVL